MAASMPSAAVAFCRRSDAAGLAWRSQSSADPSGRSGGHLEKVVTPRSPFGTVRRLPSGAYEARVTRDAAQSSVGTFPTRHQAVAAIFDATARQPGRPAHAGVLLAAWAEQWWATRAGHRPVTQRRDRAVLGLEVLPALGHRPLEELSTADVQQWVNDLAARLVPASVRRSHTVLAQLLASAMDAGLLAAAPTGSACLPRAQRHEARLLTPDELEHLASTIRPPWRAMVLTAYATLRIGEAAGLRRIDIDVEAGTLRVANSLVEVSGRLIEGPPRTAAGRRTMTMPASVMGEAEDHLERFTGPTHLFSALRGGLLHPDAWRGCIWRPAVRRAGLPPLRLHDVKHTGVAFLAAAGVDPSEISRRAGHSSVAFTYDRYGHLLPEVDRAAGAKLDDLRSRAVAKPASGTGKARHANSTDGPRVRAADLHEAPGRLASEGLGFSHTGCTGCQTLYLTASRTDSGRARWSSC